jgi:hypothetical protein
MLLEMLAYIVMLFIYWIEIQIIKTNIILSNILCKKKKET